MSALMDRLRVLAEARVKSAALSGRVNTLRKDFLTIHAKLLREEVEAKVVVSDLEAQVRVSASEVYLNTQDKKPAPGVEIKLYKTMAITDPSKALEWAHATGLALVPVTVDEAALLKIAAVTPLPFVLYGEEARVTIATTLPAAEFVEAVS